MNFKKLFSIFKNKKLFLKLNQTDFNFLIYSFFRAVFNIGFEYKIKMKY